MPEDSRAANPPQYTLGQLISDLESSERAYQANQRAADRAEAKHGVASTWWRLQAGALRFQPDFREARQELEDLLGRKARGKP